MARAVLWLIIGPFQLCSTPGDIKPSLPQLVCLRSVCLLQGIQAARPTFTHLPHCSDALQPLWISDVKSGQTEGDTLSKKTKQVRK